MDTYKYEMKIIDLNGVWEIHSADRKYRLQETVPATVFQALEKHGEFGVEGIFYRENNRRAVEIADQDFFFKRTFTLSNETVQALQDPLKRIFLEADGLDTLAEITVNGEYVGSTKNMHRRYSFDVKSMLQSGENEIAIKFSNSLEYIRREHARLPLWHAFWEAPQTAYPGFNMIRKSHCSYGWDWGPIIPDIGIWRNIKLAVYDQAKIEDIHVTQLHKKGSVELTFVPSIKNWGNAKCSLHVNITSPDGRSQVHALDIHNPTTVNIDNPELWWPNGLGRQPLYELKVSLINQNQLLHTHQLVIGLRTITVDRSTDHWGEKFAFVINGIPMFARGANYIPEDVYLARGTPEKTETLIQQAIAANFNCLRVWGGGVYPPSSFFECCDRYGLIVWQDMMFACAYYEVSSPTFLDEMRAEVTDNLKRVRHHASLGLICGNNEMEWGTVEWSVPNLDEATKTGYLKQYEKELPEIVSAICPEVFYWPASPSSGGNFDDPNAPDRGDCHYWDVWHGNKDYAEFEKYYFRFMSEFGFESFPSMKTILSFTEEEDLNIFSPVMEDHQRCVGGNGKILNYIARYFRYPKDMKSLVYISQIAQAEAIRHGIEHWRRNRGRCMGSIYWQLNDNWPVASWSSIDCFGRWKAAHYTAKRSYDSVLVSCAVEGDLFGIHISNEGLEKTEGKLIWKIISVTGEVLTGGEESCAVDALSSQQILLVNPTQYIPGNLARERFLVFSYEEKSGQIFENFKLFVPYKSLSLQKPDLKTEISAKDGYLSMAISSSCPALFVEVDFRDIDLVLPDNYFYLDGVHTKNLKMPQNGLTIEKVSGSIMLKSLADSY